MIEHPKQAESVETIAITAYVAQIIAWKAACCRLGLGATALRGFCAHITFIFAAVSLSVAIFVIVPVLVIIDKII